MWIHFLQAIVAVDWPLTEPSLSYLSQTICCQRMCFHTKIHSPSGSLSLSFREICWTCVQLIDAVHLATVINVNSELVDSKVLSMAYEQNFDYVAGLVHIWRYIHAMPPLKLYLSYLYRIKRWDNGCSSYSPININWFIPWLQLNSLNWKRSSTISEFYWNRLLYFDWWVLSTVKTVEIIRWILLRNLPDTTQL